MKTKVIVYSIFFALPFIFFGCLVGKSTAEIQTKNAVMREKIQKPDFIFEATYAYPLALRSKYLQPYYDLKLSSDTLSAYLPYYGRAYRAPLPLDEGGIKFISTNFKYTITRGSKPNNWHIHLQTFDTTRPFTLYLNVWENGNARLSVNDPDRQSIAFQGKIK